jgi:hypothetical protein
MSAPIRFPLLAVALVAALVATPRAAHAQDNMLRGPHPFLRDNELSLHVLLAEGLADTPSGTKLAFDYGYKLSVPVWLNLQLNLQFGTCHTQPGTRVCGPDTGNLAETMAGVKWKWATGIPVVPYAKAGAGLVFAFPNAAKDAAGIAARAAGGASYFFFDWLGLGAEIGFSIGNVAYDPTFPGSHTYATFDFGGGIEFQF